MTEYYVCLAPTAPDFHERFVAIDGDTAHVDIWPSASGTHKAEPGEDILVTLRRRFQGWEFHKLDRKLGEYYPRIARPGSTAPHFSPGSNLDESPGALYTRTISTGQLHALIEELRAICRVVHPTKANFKVYGHEIRNLLIIAATEVEAQWKGVLQANHAKANSRYDYVKLSPAMRLREYEVSIPLFPWLEPIKPFEAWKPTEKGVKQFLPWYDAYNAVKHDREEAFDRGTLEHAFHALAACFVMLCAQYGSQFVPNPEHVGDALFQLKKAPIWTPKEIYVLGGQAREIDYPF